MTSRRGHWRSLQDTVWLLVAIATVSMVITLHLGRSLPWMSGQSWSSETGVLRNIPRVWSREGHLNIHRSISFLDGARGAPHGDLSNLIQADPSTDSTLPGGPSQTQNARQRADVVSSGRANGDEADTKNSKGSVWSKKDAWDTLSGVGESVGLAPTESRIKAGGGRDAEVARPNRDERLLKVKKLRAVYQRLKQVEAPTVLASDSEVSVLAEGSLSAVKHHLPLIESAFHKYKASVSFRANDGNDVSASAPGDAADGAERWSILLCLNSTDKMNSCIVSGLHSSRVGHRKVNIIPELEEVLLSPSLLCSSSKHQQDNETNAGRWCGGSLPCFTQDRLVDADITKTLCKNDSKWWALWQENVMDTQLLTCSEDTAISSQAGDIFIQLPSDLLSLEASEPLVWQLEILVTSIAPLRAYVHPDGIAWQGIQAYINKKPQKNVSLMDLQQLVTDLHNEEIALKSIRNIEDAVITMLMSIENLKLRSKRSCGRCFQLIEAVMVFNNTFHPFIFHVTSTPHGDRLSSLSDYLLEQSVLDDLAAMLLADSTTSSDLLRGLSELGFTTLLNGEICNSEETFCLGGKEIIYLLDARREQGATRNWRRLCPSTSAPCFKESMAGVSEETLDETRSPAYWHKFYTLVWSLERFFLQPKDYGEISELYDDMNIPADSDVMTLGKKLADPDLIPMSGDPNLPNWNTACDNNTSSLPYLSAIHIHPPVTLQPEFSPLTTEYYAQVEYDVMLLKIATHAKNCKAEGRLELKQWSRRWTNFTLGLGENVAHIMVVNTDHQQPWALNAYTIHFHRRQPDSHISAQLERRALLKVCMLRQDCGLPFLPTEVCGLQPIANFSDWEQFEKYRASLHFCHPSNTYTGQWYIPCRGCHDRASCLWQNATWQTKECQERKLSTENVKTCLTGKKVMFIGDSTNRGIFHYISERVNGSLFHWDKTHSMEVFPYLNDRHTTFGFAYYPQFWLPQERRPVFEKALYMLMKKMSPLSNSSDTVIVLGGVHWLVKHHVDVLETALKREGLSGIRVLIKGLGAGFHQPVSGVHQISLNEHQKLLSQNQVVMSHARSKGFLILDTFNMTMARYKDFLPGKCACHFHKVSPIHPPILSKLSNLTPHSSDHRQKFHVEGQISAAYSDIAINRICFPDSL